MKIQFRTHAARASALLMVAGLAYAAQPPDVVQSDPANNTAMGTAALADLSSGAGNTAA